ncbi:MAG: GGDEF domain-containing protein [Desulfobacterales bacterium]|nr:MAG: GGDEF domain-containing protein [Desulfobacterales bacterium]
MNKLAEQRDTNLLDAGHEQINQVMDELDQLKRQSERLDLINRLHSRMAGVLNMTGMIEAYSVWLMPIVTHELIGYNNSKRNKKHLFCSSHGPNRRNAIAFAEKLISDISDKRAVVRSDDGYFGHRWIFEGADNTGILLILKDEEALTEWEQRIINDSLSVLIESLQRGLEYEDLFQRASSDALTGLANRRVFDERIKRMMDNARRYHNPLTMLSLDLDKFKEINDNLGHQAGDETLIQVADLLAASVRSTDLLVRMGGDEFIIVLNNTDQVNAQILAERLVDRIDRLDIWADDMTKLGVSIGCAELMQGEDVQDWMERTDDILYHAKAEGRARVAVV